MLVELVGTEALSLELNGTISLAHARSLLEGLEPETRGERAVASVLLFRMTGMRARGVPSPALDYGEALWRVGVVHERVPAWFALRCDLDHPLVRILGKTAIRYPVRTARFHFVDAEYECTFTVDAGDARLDLFVTRQGTPCAPEPPRRVLARAGRTLYEIPWREDPPPHVDPAQVTWRDASLVRATLGADVVWDPEGRLLRGRVHRCGLAHPLRGSAAAAP